MTARTLPLCQALAAVLLVVLTLTGIGRATAIAEAPPHATITLAGITVPICHHDAGDPSPTHPTRHDCCDACALCVPVLRPEGAPFIAPARVEPIADPAAALIWAPTLARIPTPRLSQGPPAA